MPQPTRHRDRFDVFAHAAIALAAPVTLAPFSLLLAAIMLALCAVLFLVGLK